MFTRWSHFLIISFLLLFALFLFYYSICVWWKRNEKRTNFAALVQWQYWWRRQSFSETLWEKHVVSRKKNLSLQLGCNFNYIFKAENWQQPPNVKNCVASGIRLFKHIHLFSIWKNIIIRLFDKVIWSTIYLLINLRIM